eukprot:TRINITY_DN12289_c0_g1_i1.p1 TRINITY_DN12289_c0_g1~~TRINITY_DN12289_c0_g1_i1.p1  ORF type:complete len:108 (+),score=44.33 TRINITY_DN12289_c0_g1_i1:153-476(+)
MKKENNKEDNKELEKDKLKVPFDKNKILISPPSSPPNEWIQTNEQKTGKKELEKDDLNIIGENIYELYKESILKRKKKILVSPQVALEYLDEEENINNKEIDSKSDN